MGSSGAALPPGGDDSQAVNPYAASEVGEPRTVASGTGGAPVVRHYQARMDWSDRQAFLRSVGPTRVTVLMNGLMHLQSVLATVVVWQGFFTRDTIRDFMDIGFLALAVVTLGTSIITLGVCWLGWKYADALQKVAGGTAKNMGTWSQLHYRIEWLNAAVISTNFLSGIGYWLLSRNS
jgi:hypothetical protein